MKELEIFDNTTQLYLIGDISEELYYTINNYCCHSVFNCYWKLIRNKQYNNVKWCLINKKLFNNYGNIEPQLKQLEFLIENFFWPNNIIVCGCIEYSAYGDNIIKDKNTQLKWLENENKTKEKYYNFERKYWPAHEEIVEIALKSNISIMQEELYLVELFRQWDNWWQEKLIRFTEGLSQTDNRLSKISNQYILKGYGCYSNNSLFNMLWNTGIGKAWLAKICEKNKNNKEYFSFVNDKCNWCTQIYCYPEVCDKCAEIYETLRCRYKGESGFILVDTGRCFLFDNATEYCQYRNWYADWNTFVTPYCKSSYKDSLKMNRKYNWGIMVF